MAVDQGGEEGSGEGWGPAKEGSWTDRGQRRRLLGLRISTPSPPGPLPAGPYPLHPATCTPTAPRPFLADNILSASFMPSAFLSLLLAHGHSELPGQTWVSTLRLQPSSFSLQKLPESGARRRLGGCQQRRPGAPSSPAQWSTLWLLRPTHWSQRDSNTCSQPFWLKCTSKKLHSVFQNPQKNMSVS